MNENVDATILEKIRKVAGYLKSDNPNEAANAAAKLSELLLKYNLDASQIPQSERVHDPFITDRVYHKRLEDWRIDLAHAIAKANLCRIVLSQSTLVWLGRKSNVEVAQYINDTVVADLERLASVFWLVIKQAYQDNQNELDFNLMHGRTFKQQFYVGAVKTIKERLQVDLTELQAGDGNIRALVVRNDSELNDYTRSVFPHLGYRTARQSVSGSAYSLGRAAGANVQFKTGIGSGGANGTRRIGSGR